MQNIKSSGYHRIGLWVILTWLLMGCSTATSSTSSPTPPPISSETATQPQITPTQTSVPTDTPAPGRVILLAAEGSQPGLQALLGELSQAENLSFNAQPSITPSEIGPEVRLVLATSPDPGIASLAAGAPMTQFLAIGIPGLEPAANLSVLSGAGQHPDKIGFLAGYLAAAITEHWRVGMLSISDDLAGQTAWQGFNNGVVYFCGLCRPAYPPYVQYPVFAAVPANAVLTEQQAAVDSLVSQSVNTVFVAGSLMNPELAAYLASNEIHVISDALPPLEDDPNWVATVSPGDISAAIRQLWPGIMAGNPGGQVE
ncbi:MAG TPA: hypothetical protein VN363_09425, partial [Anaerolineales bacterium]|nr:hypothetical protein [Anaerolineales bacterium]